MPSGSVLIIDDNQDILDVARLLLEAEGFKVFTAEDCNSALKHLSLHNPDVIVTDLLISGITGLELIHQLKRTANLDRIPVIAMSAYDKTYLAAAVGAGAVDALHKPEELDRIVEAVEQAIAHRP